MLGVALLLLVAVFGLRCCLGVIGVLLLGRLGIDWD